MKTKQKVMYIPETVHAEAKAAAKANGFTLEGFTVRALKAEIDRQGDGLRAKVKGMTRKG